MSGTPSGTLSPAQIGQVAAGAGFTGNDLKIAVAVALAESGGNPRDHNDKGRDNSYGLWQINMLGTMGPDRRKKFGIATNDALYDPATNARAAHIIWKESGWDAWTTYTSGKYKDHLTDVGRTDGGDSTLDTIKRGAQVIGSAISPTNVSASISNSIDNFGKNIYTGLASLIAMFVASALLIIGLVILMRNTAPVKTAKGAVKAYATRGVKKVVK